MIGEIDHEVLSEDLVAVEPEKEGGHGDEDRGETPQSSSSRLAKICRLSTKIVHHPMQDKRWKRKGNLLKDSVNVSLFVLFISGLTNRYK